MSQIILAVSDEGKFLEYIPKTKGHTGEGKRHLAIAVLLYNSKGEVLLQKRKHQIFDSIWDITGATHPLHKPHPCHSEERSDVGILKSDSSQALLINQDCHALRARNDNKCRICHSSHIDETLEEATRRCLKEEWNIKDIKDIKILGNFNYFAQYGDLCENEHCYLLIGQYDGNVDLNKNLGYEYKWADKNQFLEDIKIQAQKYTPWAIKSVEILEKASFFANR